ncbi:MAG: class I SAM-dependent methyltransferase, partial [Bacilli bacterium]
MLKANEWIDYKIIDASNGEKLEKWGDVVLLRPDPQIIWDDRILIDEYLKSITSIYHRSNKGGGYWEDLKELNMSWQIKYKDLTFCLKKMGFKHTGLFPEQAVNWDFMRSKIRQANRPLKVLNLFAYTGAATVACLKEGASVVHVDSSKGMVLWAKENVKVNNLEKEEVRYIVDDVLKFVEREGRRGNLYDAIIMDPPSYGRGSNGEVWDINKDLLPLLRMCKDILVEKPLFFIINSYTSVLASEVISNLLK